MDALTTTVLFCFVDFYVRCVKYRTIHLGPRTVGVQGDWDTNGTETVNSIVYFESLRPGDLIFIDNGTETNGMGGGQRYRGLGVPLMRRDRWWPGFCLL